MSASKGAVARLVTNHATVGSGAIGGAVTLAVRAAALRSGTETQAIVELDRVAALEQLMAKDQHQVRHRRAA